MICKNCNAEVDKKAKICVKCGCKIKKPIYKKWWFWLVVAVVLIVAVSNGGGEGNNLPETQQSSGTPATVIEYETVDLGIMYEELKSNAMKAENNYNNKHIEFSAKIKSFDSDGKYVSVEPVNADEWNFESSMCYIKNEQQKNILVEKNVGDIIKIKGKVKSVGEVLGYSIDIAEVE